MLVSVTSQVIRFVCTLSVSLLPAFDNTSHCVNEIITPREFLFPHVNYHIQSKSISIPFGTSAEKNLVNLLLSIIHIQIAVIPILEQTLRCVTIELLVKIRN